MPTKKQWLEDTTTPSDMPIRVNYGSWTNFIIACGREPRVSEFTNEARTNSIKARTGKKGGNNKGGRIKDKNGYISVWQPNHGNSRSAGYVHEHRLIMSNILNRPLERHENVHHINGVRDDNRIENLELWTTQQPSGQRVEDKISWAIKFLKGYGYETTKI